MSSDILKAELMDLYASTAYEDLLESVRAELNLDVSNSIQEITYVYDARNLQAANISVSCVVDFIKNDADNIKKFIVEKIISLRGESIKQEYSPGDEPAEEDKDSESVILPYYKNFLSIYLFEYIVLRDKPDTLLNFSKMIRIPFASKYVKQLKAIYDKACK